MGDRRGGEKDRYEGQSKSNKTRVTAPFIKSRKSIEYSLLILLQDKIRRQTISHSGKLEPICRKNTKFEGVIRNESKIMTK